MVSAHFGRHRDAEIYASQPGLGTILAARVLGEFGEGRHRYLDAKARKCYAGIAPITHASGKKKIVLARYARNRRLATHCSNGRSAQCVALPVPGPTTNYATATSATKRQLRQLANRLVGILHGCLKPTPPTTSTAWAHHTKAAA